MAVIFTMEMLRSAVTKNVEGVRYFIHTNGHYKYYKIEEFSDHAIVSYGRIGASPQTRQYDLWKARDKANEKLRKGYVEVFSNHDIDTYFGKA